MSVAPGPRVAAGFAALAPPIEVYPLGVADELGATGPLPGARPVLVYGRHALLAPAPGGRGCPRCLARRWQAGREPDLRDALDFGREAVAVGESPYATPFAAEALRALLAAVPDRRVYQLDLESLQVRSVPLIPDADCPVCAEPIRADSGGAGPTRADSAGAGPIRADSAGAGSGGAVAAAPELPPVPKRAPDAFRTRDVDDQDIPVTAFVNPICGPLGTSLWTDLMSPTTAPVNGVFRVRAGRSLWKMLHGGHADGYRRSARLSVLEGLERAAGVRPSGARHTITATYDELGAAALDPRICGLYSDAFYAANPDIVPFAPDRPITWIHAWSLRDQRPVLVPEILVYYLAGTPERRFVQESSNGCASGGSLVEAIYHGLMEVVERDAFLLAWYAARALPEVDPRTSRSARTRAMTDRLEMHGYRARFFDARSDLGIPVVTAVAERIDGGFGALAFGGGAGLDPETAMAAALCEIASDAAMVRTRARFELDRLRSMVDDFDNVHGLHDHPLLYALPEMRPHASFLLDTGVPARPVADVYADAPPLAGDLRDDLDYCVATVAARGFDVLVADQTLPEQRDLGVHTASVTVPGLLPIDFGWTRQRALGLPRLRTAATGGIHPVPHPYP